MTANGALQTLVYLAIVLVLVKPLGWYMAQVYEGKPCGLNQIGSPLERFIYRCCAISPDKEMGWKKYLWAMILFNVMGIFAIYLITRLQFYLPLNPQGFSANAPDLAFNTAVSFTTNTNWQAYSGESEMSYLTQMLALTVQNFLSAATGMSILMAFIRGLSRSETSTLGNFWVDMVRTVLYILLPLAFIVAIFLASQGVIQNFKPYESITLLQPVSYQETQHDLYGNATVLNKIISEQQLPMGPVASQEAIKQLGTNGGGFFNVNSAHPFEAPTPLAGLIEMVAILLIPAALCYTYGLMINNKRQGWTILIAMLCLLVPFMIGAMFAEQRGNPAFTSFGVDQEVHELLSAGGNMEGKETRFGIVDSALWTAATTATANGSVNSMIDSYTPLGGFVPLWLMHMGEVAFGGVGTGLFSMLLFIIITAFVAGLMVGRTPEYLGKKIEPFEMKMASFSVLVMPMIVLIFTAIAAVTTMGYKALGNPGAHGFTEMLYAFTSMTNNNGSAFAGLNANTTFYNLVGGITMLIGRFWVAIPVMAIAGSLARKKFAPITTGTLATDTPLFVVLLIGIIFILGALSFLPALCLGPIVEHLLLWGQYGHQI